MTSQTQSNSGEILTAWAALVAQYWKVRGTTERLCEPLDPRQEYLFNSYYNFG